MIGATLNGSAYAQNTKIEIGETGGRKGTANASGNRSIALGEYSNAQGDQAIAIGSSDKTGGRATDPNIGNHAKGHESIAIGGDVVATGDASIAIGSDDLHLTDNNGGGSSSSGNQIRDLVEKHPELKKIRDGSNNTDKYSRTHAKGHASIAVGAMTQAEGHFSNAFGTRAIAKGNYALAVGLTARANNESSIAVGSNAEVTKFAGLALGTNTKVDVQQGIALGYGSQVLNNNNNNNAYIPTNGGSRITQSHKATNNVGPLSIGSNSLRRRIINVGAGSQDTDAVNVAQLRAVEDLANRKVTLAGDIGGNVQKSLGDTLTIKGGEAVESSLANGANIGVVKENDGLKVKLAKNLSDLTSVSATTKITVGNTNNNNAELQNGGLTLTSTTSASTEKTVYGVDGLKFNANNGAAIKDTTRITKDKIGFADASGVVDKESPYLDKKQLKVGKVEITKDGGINAGNQKITKLADGANDTDAVTIKQLKDAKPTLTGGTGIEISNTTSLSVADNGTITAPSYTIKVKTTELTDTGSGGGKFAVSGTNNGDSLVTATNLASYLNTVNQTADNALPSFKVQNDSDSASAITVDKNTNRNTLKLKGENGVDIKTDQATGTVTFGINQSGLTTPKLTVGSSNGKNQLVIEQVAGTNGNSDKNIIRGLSPILPSIADQSGRNIELGNTIQDDDKSKAASINDILNTGFNLKNNNNSVDFVSTYDIVDFANGNATTATVTHDVANKTSKVAYDVNVDEKTIELTGDNGTKNKIGVKTTKLTKTDASGNTATNFSVNSGDEDALVKASDIKDNLNILAGEIHAAKGTADTALQTFQVKKVKENGDDDNDADTITVGKDGTSGKVNTLKLKGKNGLDIKTDKDGTVTFGINTTSGLKAGDNTTLNNNGLSIKSTTGSEQIQVGADGVKFAKVNNGSSTGIDGTSRITKDQIGFANSTGQVDINKPHLSKDGINAGGKKITNIQSGEITQNSNDAVTGGKIYDLKTELESKISSTAKTAQNSLHEFSVADEHGNNFTVSNPYSSYDTSKTSDVITFAGENGITTKVNKGVVRVGIDQTKGLTTPKLTVGNNNGKGIVIDSQNGQNTITGLSNTLANVTNDGAGHALSQGLADNTDKTRAASIGDVLNAGFNLQGNGTAVDFVSTYDTVNFANGNTTTAKVTYDDTSKTSQVVYDVNVDDTTIEVKDKKLGVKTTTLTSTGTGANKFALSNQATGDALVKASDIVAHLNTLSGDIQTAKGASQANSSAGYVNADGNKVIYDSTDNKYYQAKNDGTVDKTKEVAKDKLVAQAQTPDGTLAQMNVKSVINKEQVNDANKKQGINEDNAFVKGLEKAASDNKTKNAAVTVGDLNAVAQTPLTFAGDTGTTAKKLGETLTIKGGQTDTNKLTDNNIGVVAGTDGFTVKLAKDLTNLNSVNAGGTKIDEKGISFVDANGQAKANTPVLSANGLDLGGKVISNVGKGTKDTDAANVQQLNEVRNLLGLGNAGNDNADGNQVNIADIKKDPNSGSSSNRTVIKAGTVLGGKGNNDTEKLATGGVQVGVDKDGNANGDLSNVWVKTQKDGSKKALLATYNAAGQTNYVTNNPAEAIDRINEQGIRFFHVNDGNQEPVVQGRNGIDSSASGKHSVAIGYKAKADGEAAVAIGRQTQAGNQSIAIGDNAQATGDQSIAIGTGNVVAGKHSGAIGDPSTVKADNSYSVGNNNQFTDATQTDVFGVGNNITVTESNSVALGSNSAISAGTHAGTQAKKSDGTAGTTTTAGATGTVKGFAGQTAVGAVSVGASGAERRIQNVAAGEVSATSTDAVNGSQLYKATQSIANATNELDHRIHQNENKANAGISSAMAMASMPQAYIPGRSMVTGGIATHNGQGAVAVGLSKLSDNGQWVFKINGSADTQGHVGAAVGAGFHF
ncbi:adhesin [Moraxella catarrhalis]|nr:adhesin [Moraxella catarrhalis]RKM39822.1 adhesin [Moraxella catarrhalis]RKM40089.1 adhesin [Moraxella catarrhalis]RKM42374.1 adhesin [Moraxella catarrhalis]